MESQYTHVKGDSPKKKIKVSNDQKADPDKMDEEEKVLGQNEFIDPYDDEFGNITLRF